jgi:hypothetical protein
MIRVSLTSIRTIRIGGIERGDGVTVALLRELIQERQETIADLFAAEQTVKGKLKANKPSYDAAKAAAGLDTRRGHREGFLQAALDHEKLWEVKIVRPKGKPGHAYLSFAETKLIEAVPHYRYYRDGTNHHSGKTPGGHGVLVMTRKWVQEIQRALRAIADAAAAGRLGRKRLRDRAKDSGVERARFRA